MQQDVPGSQPPLFGRHSMLSEVILTTIEVEGSMLLLCVGRRGGVAGYSHPAM